MPNKNIDILFITQLPSFYKINLFNKLSRHLNIYVIFIGGGSIQRNFDFISLNFEFESIIINSEKFEIRNKLHSIIKLKKILNNLRFKKVIVNGWDLLEFWYINLFINKQIGLILESSIYESRLGFISKALKKFFLKNIDFVMAAGQPHVRLLNVLNYKNQIHVNNGVGLPNYSIKFVREFTKRKIQNFLYVGRLSDEKNLIFLVEAFKNFPELNLTIIGTGPLEVKLKYLASANVTFLGYVENKELPKYYTLADVFVLPSISEPWGLVIEEALHFSLPLLISENVGCQDLYIDKYKSGIKFNPFSFPSFKNAIISIQDIKNYNAILLNIGSINFDKLYDTQIENYLFLFKE